VGCVFDLQVERLPIKRAMESGGRSVRRPFAVGPRPSPIGGKLERRAIQLGLRAESLEKYSREWIIEITDVSDFVRQQRENSQPSRYDQLVLPRERVYPVSDEMIVQNLRLQHVG
jgi:hypothetical protein